MANHHTKGDQNQQRQEQQQQQRHQGVENGTLTLSRDKGHPACEPTECRPPGGSETRGCRGAGSQGGCACGRGTWAAETPGWRRWTSTDQPERSGWSHTTHERRTLVSARWQSPSTPRIARTCMISTGTLCETPLSARTWRWVVGTVLCLRMPLPGWCALVLLSASNLFLSLVLSMVCVRRCVVTHLAHSWLLARESLNDDASLAPLHSPPSPPPPPTLPPTSPPTLPPASRRDPARAKERKRKAGTGLFHHDGVQTVNHNTNTHTHTVFTGAHTEASAPSAAAASAAAAAAFRWSSRARYAWAAPRRARRLLRCFSME